MDRQAEKELAPVRIIVLAMTTGLVLFTTVALAIDGRMASPELSRVLLPVLGLLGVSEIGAYVFLRTATWTSIRRQIADKPAADAELVIAGGYRTLVLIRSAMIEGWGLFGVVSLMLTGHRTVLAAPVLAIVLLVANLPTRDRLADCITRMTDRNPYAG